MNISSASLTPDDVSVLLNSVHYFEVIKNEEDLRGVTACIWEKLQSLQFTHLEKKTVKELCGQFVDKTEIDHIQNGLQKIIHFTDPNEERVIRKLQYISSKLGTKKNDFLAHLVPTVYWTRSIIEEAYRAFSREASSRELLQTEHFNIFQSVQRILENFDKTEPLRTPLFFTLLCMQKASGLNLSIQAVERCFLAFLDESIDRRYINLDSIDSFAAFHFCVEFMLSFRSGDIKPLYQRYMESKQKKNPVDNSWKDTYRQEKIKQSSPAPSETILASKTRFSNFVRRRSIGRDLEDKEMSEEQFELLPQEDTYSPVKKAKTSPKQERPTISFSITSGEKYLQKIKRWRLESDAEGIQHLMKQLDQEEPTLSPKEYQFYLYAKKRIQDLQITKEVDAAEACDLFIKHYEDTLKNMFFPTDLYGRIPLQVSSFPRLQKFIFTALRQDEEWLQSECKKPLGPKELKTLEETIDHLACSSEKNLISKQNWYAQIFADLEARGLSKLILSSDLQQISKGDAYEIAKTKIDDLAIMRKIREEEIELLGERDRMSKQAFKHKMRRIQERDRAVRDIVFSLIMSREYFSNSIEIQFFFGDCLCPFLVLMNGRASIYFPQRLKALLREYNLMHSFLPV